MKPADFLFDTPRDAVDALAAYGCPYDGRFDVTEEVEGIGTVHRFFGVLPNVLTAEAPAQAVIYERMVRLLDDPDNRKVAAKLREGALDHTPINKTAAKAVVKDLLGVHLPWAFSLRNLPLMLALEEAHEDDGLGFIVIYNQFVEVGGGEVKPGKLFSQSIESAGSGTWMQPIYEDLLDDDVALMIEATVRG